MSVESVQSALVQKGFADRVRILPQSSATVPLAAAALGVPEERIAKTLSFVLGERVLLIVCAGDARIDNPKYKAQFGGKAKMLPFEETEERTGHAVGGVCPFALKQGVETYLDVSLQRFDVIYPAAGSANSSVRLTPQELEQAAENFAAWIDVCKLPQ